VLWLSTARHLLPENAVPALNTFVLYFALPCMLSRFVLARRLTLQRAGLSPTWWFPSSHSSRDDASRQAKVSDATFAALAVSWSNWLCYPLMPRPGRGASLIAAAWPTCSW
jgi:hypothetical protein